MWTRIYLIGITFLTILDIVFLAEFTIKYSGNFTLGNIICILIMLINLSVIMVKKCVLDRGVRKKER